MQIRSELVRATFVGDWTEYRVASFLMMTPYHGPLVRLALLRSEMLHLAVGISFCTITARGDEKRKCAATLQCKQHALSDLSGCGP